MKINLVSFYSEGEPIDKGINLTEQKNIFIANAQNNVDNISLYSPQILKDLNYNNYVKEYPVSSLVTMNTNINYIGFLAWKPLIILLELNKMNDGDILVYRDINCIKYPQLKNFNNFKENTINLLNINNFDFFISFDPFGFISENLCKTNIIKKLGEDHIFSYNYPMLIANQIIIRKSRISEELLNEWLLNCNIEEYIDGNAYGEMSINFKRSTPEQSILTIIIANWIRKRKYNIPIDYPKIILIDINYDNPIERPEFNHLKFLEIENFTNIDSPKKFNYDNTVIIIARYKEDTDWVSKLNKFKNIFIYEKEKPDKEPYNIPKNRGGEASAYIRFIIDNYDNLPNHLVLLHCHEFSWHHKDSIITVLNESIDTEIEYKNINDPTKCYDMGDYQDWINGDTGNYYQNLIKPAVGAHTLYDNFTNKQPGCAQFIVYKDRILYHTIDFYKDIYNWILNVDVTFYNHGFYLEWTWELFWNRCFQNTPIKLYNNEKILYVFQLNDKLLFDSDITDTVIDELDKNNYFKVTDSVKIIISIDNIITKEVIANKFIYNKFK
jgi:hypothetical protein